MKIGLQVRCTADSEGPAYELGQYSIYMVRIAIRLVRFMHKLIRTQRTATYYRYQYVKPWSDST